METEVSPLEVSARIRKRRILALENRLEYITSKIDAMNCSEKSLSFLKGEQAALIWALELIGSLVELRRVEDESSQSGN